MTVLEIIIYKDVQYMLEQTSVQITIFFYLFTQRLDKEH